MMSDRPAAGSPLPSFASPGPSPSPSPPSTPLSLSRHASNSVVIDLSNEIPININDYQSLPLPSSSTPSEVSKFLNTRKVPNLTLSFSDVSFALKHKNPKTVKRSKEKGYALLSDERGGRKILNSISGRAPAGQLTAILGPSGAGKSTLLDILSCRKNTGRVTGVIRVNGQIATRQKLTRHSGYVLQDDMLMGTLTVEETLTYSARLRLPQSTSLDTCQKVVDQVISELGLDAVRDSRIGNEFVRGLSGGEKKRVCIGQELVTFPSILFLDEPTSGLDSFSAMNIMTTLKALASKGRTIAFTIHQPSSDIVKLFDNILLLTETGELAFYGPAKEALLFFSSRCGLTCDTFTNPCDFLLSIVSSKSIRSDDNQIKNIIDTFASSELANQLRMDLRTDENMKGASNERKTNLLLYDEDMTSIDDNTSMHVTSPLHQFMVMTHRTFINYIRNPMETYVLLGVSIFFALLIGSIYFRIPHTQSGFRDRSGAIFFVIMNTAFSNLASLETLIKDRALFIRERANGMYRPIVYFISKMIIDLPTKIIPALVGLVMSYWMMGLNDQWDRFLIYIATNVLTTWISYSMCLMVSSFSPTFSIANLVAPVILVLMMLPSGFLQNSANIPVYWYWLKYISLFKYAYEALIVNELTGQSFYCEDSELVPQGCQSLNLTCTCPIETGDAGVQALSLRTDWIQFDLIILLSMVIAYLSVALFFIIFTHKEKR